jgi:hypothetical protein
MIYFPSTNKYLIEARGGAEREISSNRYSNTCRRQRRGKRKKQEEEEKREDNYQMIRIRDDTSKVIDFKNYCRRSWSHYTEIKPAIWLSIYF